MSDVPTPWCPVCAPERDEITEFLEISWCGRHMPNRAGLDDAGVVGTPEVTVTNQQWCDLLHGRGADALPRDS